VSSFRPPHIGVGGQTSLAKFLIEGPKGPLNWSIKGPLGPHASLFDGGDDIGHWGDNPAIMAGGGPPVETLIKARILPWLISSCYVLKWKLPLRDRAM
jgi:hypothetical protein